MCNVCGYYPHKHVTISGTAPSLRAVYMQLCVVLVRIVWIRGGGRTRFESHVM